MQSLAQCDPDPVVGPLGALAIKEKNRGNPCTGNIKNLVAGNMLTGQGSHHVLLFNTRIAWTGRAAIDAA